MPRQKIRPLDHLMKENRRAALMELIRGYFGEREFGTAEFAEKVGYSRTSASYDLGRLYYYGDLQRRRMNGKANYSGFLYSLREKREAARWRNKDCSLLPDEERVLIARVVALQVGRKFGRSFTYDELYSEALYFAFSIAKINGVEKAERPKAWEAVVVRNYVFSRLFQWCRSETKAKKYLVADADMIASRGNLYEDMMRQEVAAKLAELVWDAGLEVASPREWEALDYLIQEQANCPADKLSAPTMRLSAKIGDELWDESRENLAELLDDQTASELLAPYDPSANAYYKKARAKRVAYREMIEQCLNGDRPLPRRDCKNVALLKQLNEVF